MSRNEWQGAGWDVVALDERDLVFDESSIVREKIHRVRRDD